MRVSLTLNTDFIDGMVGLVDELADATEREANAVYGEYAPRLEADLQYEPPEPQGRIQWKNERQRRRVLALLRQQAIERGDYHVGPRGGIVIDDLSYERTHRYARGWRVVPIYDGTRFILGVSNEWSAAPFVGGSLNMRSLSEAAEPQQPFHAGRWPLVAQRVAYWFNLMQAEFSERMADTFGDYVKTAAKRRSRR